MERIENTFESMAPDSEAPVVRIKETVEDNFLEGGVTAAIVGALFFLATAVNVYLITFATDREDIVLASQTYYALASGLLMLVLLFVANNWATRLVCLGFALLNAVQWFTLTHAVPSFAEAWTYAQPIACVYLYSVFLQSNPILLEREQRELSHKYAWVNVLAACQVLPLVVALYRHWIGDATAYLEPDHLLIDSFAFKLLTFLVYVLSTIAIARFCWSPAFGGPFDKWAKGCYSPLNKWMAMILIGPVVTCVLLYVFFNEIL